MKRPSSLKSRAVPATASAVSISNASPRNGGSGNGAGGRSPEKYDLILNAAIEVIAENGFFNSRVADIAQRAGVADGTVYLYFKNKEQILMAAIDFAFDLFLRRAKSELTAIASPRDRLRHLARLHFEMLGSHRSLAAVFQTELRQSVKFLRQFSKRRLIDYFDLIRAIVRDGQREGVFRANVSDKIAANCFFGALDEMVTSWVLSERDYPLADAADAVVDVILNGMEVR